MRHIRLHWVVLGLYFLFGSAILLSANTSHHSDAVLPYVLILLPLLLLFWNPSRKMSNLSLASCIVVLFFVVLHIAPFVPLSQAHHQSSDQVSHTCCMPQIGVVVSGFLLGMLSFFIIKLESEIIRPDSILSFNLFNSRAPPQRF